MKYLKYLQTANDFESFKNSTNYVTPNVSYIVETEDVSFEPYVESSFKMVDLGLPSGLLWADRNIGAASPEEIGLYFQWGDTVGYTAEQVGTDKVFDWDNYFDLVNGSYYNFNKYANDKLKVLQPEDDAATVNMGSDYRMPTEADFNELIDNCAVTFIDLQGNEFSKSEAKNDSIDPDNYKGIKFTGSNGNSIFIPASGGCYDSGLEEAYVNGNLWSSSLHSSYSTEAYFLSFDYNGSHWIHNYFRYCGYAVRGVK